MITAFNENYKAPHVAPECGNDGATDDFYDRLDERMGEIGPDVRETEFLHRLLIWLLPKARNRRSTEAMGYKLLSAMWVIDPGFFDGKSISQIAREIGLAPSTLANFTGDFSREFGIVNRGQAHNPHLKGRHKTDGPPNKKAAQDGKSSAAETKGKLHISRNIRKRGAG